MPSKKTKTKRKQAKSQSPISKQAKKAGPKKRVMVPKRTATKKQSQKKRSSKAGVVRKKKAPVRRAHRVESTWRNERATSADQTGDLEGLSRAEEADSESVDELVEEGNVFEAGAVAGVQEADDEDTREVHTHEVPEDDVPEEYLDKD
jgi:hypothetical protein